MLQKTALFIASLAASATLAVALATAGFAPGTPAAPAVAPTAAADTATPAPPTVQVDKVYIPAPQPQQTITVHKVVKTSGGEADTESGD